MNLTLFERVVLMVLSYLIRNTSVGHLVSNTLYNTALTGVILESDLQKLS